MISRKTSMVEWVARIEEVSQVEYNFVSFQSPGIVSNVISIDIIGILFVLHWSVVLSEEKINNNLLNYSFVTRTIF